MNLSPRQPFLRTAIVTLLVALGTTALPLAAVAQDDSAVAAAPTAAAPAEPAAQAEPATAEGDTQPYDASIAVEPTATEAAADVPPADAAGTDDAVKLGTVEVTGSRLKRTDFESAQPVFVVRRDEIERSGLTSIGDLLQNMSVAGSALNTTFNNGGNGETNIDLRNLGANRVLVLVNGRRWVNGLNSLNTSAVDLNTIPVSIIERIEVLKDGASAIYGSDAIAGVINIITRKNYSGSEIRTQYGSYDEGDGAIQQHAISLGSVGSSTSWFADLSYTRHDEVSAGDRDISKVPLFGTGVSRGSTGTPEGRFLFVPTPSNGVLLGNDRCPVILGPGDLPPVADPSLPTLPLPPLAGVQLCDITHVTGAGTQPITTSYRPFDPVNDPYNFAPINYLETPNERTALFTQLRAQLTDSISFTFEGLYNRRESSQLLAEQPLFLGDAVGKPFDRIYVDATNQYNPFLQDIGRADPAAGLVGLGAILRRMVELGPRVFNQSVDTIRLGGGFNGSFDLLDQYFAWDAGYAYTTNENQGEGFGELVVSRLARALGPATDCTGDCVPLNVFGGPGTITRDMLDYITFTNDTIIKQTSQDVYANISTDLGPIRLPAGPIGVAFGVEYREEKFKDVPDEVVQAGDTIGNAQEPTSGAVRVQEAFVELGIPLLADLPLIQQLELSLAGRYSSYNLAGDTTTGKAGLKWRVYDDLLLRTTVSEAFRAPSTGELFLGSAFSQPEAADPCVPGEGSPRNDPTTDANCDADGVPEDVSQLNGQITSVFSGNKDLKPETAKSFTAGIVFSPEFVPNLNLSADYFDIRLEDFISVPDVQFVLDSCYTGEQRALCELVQRNSGNGSLSQVNTPFVNFAALETSGIDMAMDYQLPFIPDNFGRFKLIMDATYLIAYTQFLPVPGGGSEASEGAGTNANNTGYPRWKANGELLWKIGGLTASWQTRFIYHQIEDCNDGRDPSLSSLGLCSDPAFESNPDGSQSDVSKNELKTTFYHDVQLSYYVQDYKLTLVAGVNNVLDQDPPVSFTAFANSFDVTQYELPGRFPYLRLTKKF
jgi:iron complex outermembrane receptor protein